MQSLYPLKFQPILKDKIWGGAKLQNMLGKKSGDQCGESWEVSGVVGDTSIVMNGVLSGKNLQEILNLYGADLVGDRVLQRFGKTFPLLVKFIDAADDLSVQVHPNDEQSGGQGKTEMWYVVDADPDATLLSGFRDTFSKDELLSSVKDGTFSERMIRVPVSKGDVFKIQANQVHTIGKGILILEIQQSSDITYRIYDFDRRDASGKKRKLHLEEAFEVMNVGMQTGKVDIIPDQEELIDCPEFVVSKWNVNGSKWLPTTDVFRVIVNIEGDGQVIWNEESLRFSKGESILIPCNLDVTIKSQKPLEVISASI